MNNKQFIKTTIKSSSTNYQFSYKKVLEQKDLKVIKSIENDLYREIFGMSKIVYNLRRIKI